jgi:hypothetical protein
VTLMISLMVSLWLAPALHQDVNFWQVLAEVSFQKQIKDGYEWEVPQFSKHLQSWNGKKIRLKGFIVPAGEVGDAVRFMFSALPFNVCYFCGAAGPETIVELDTKEKIVFTTKALWVEGVLQLNASNPNQHIYILRSAKIITP